MKKLLVCIFSLTLLAAFGGERVKFTINDNWRFTEGSPFNAQQPQMDDSAWSVVNIPHSWNAVDGDDETPGYYRGPAWYRRSIAVDDIYRGCTAYIYFEGANQQVKLYVNGHFAGEHKGGYTRFCFDVTELLNYGAQNVLAICVDNSHNPNIPPLSADFTFYGGIYRDLYFIFADPIHIAPTDRASSGVTVLTPQVSRQRAEIKVQTRVANNSDKARRVRVEQLVMDASGEKVVRQSNEIEIAARSTVCDESNSIKIATPRLWDIDDPYMYTLNTIVYDVSTGEITDRQMTPVGLRYFSFDPDKGFSLNGRYRKLTGTNRHQDYLHKANALRDEMHVRDIMTMKQMGSNFLRVSHYPQDPVILELCDRLGIVCSVEIPVVNAVTETAEFSDNCVEMAHEMISQNRNHPSVMIWAYMNEVLLRPPFKSNTPQMDNYLKSVESIARRLDKTIRDQDPSRYTMIAFHNNPKGYDAAHLTDIPMIQGWNLYQGWYEPDMNEFQRLLDRLHAQYKDKVLIVTEYGPGVDPRLHSFTPERFDFTQEYGIVYHSHYLHHMMARPFVAGFNMWNFNDFYAEQRVDAVPHVNNKGVTGLDRERKDTYLFYRASLATEPVLLIGNRCWQSRGGAQTSKEVCVQPVPVFTNLKSVELVVNGKSLGVKSVKECMVKFDVPFVNGENVIEAISGKGGKSVRDIIRINFSLIPQQLSSIGKDFTQMNIMLGSHRYFEDRTAELAWIPEQPYKAGSWGYVGGEPYRRKTSFGSMLGSEIDIYGTDQNPIFQTQRVGIEAFRADLPDGLYSVYLYWAELDSSKSPDASVYNLGADAVSKEYHGRRFGVSINGERVLEGFDPAANYGFARGAIVKFEVNVSGGKGLTVSFNKEVGEPILNAIRIYKNL